MTTKSTSRKGPNAQANLLHETYLTEAFNMLLARWKDNMMTSDSDLDRLSDLSEGAGARDVLQNVEMSHITYWDKADHHDYADRYLETNLPSTCEDMLYLAAQIMLIVPQMSKANITEVGHALLAVETILHQTPIKVTPYMAMVCEADGCVNNATTTIAYGSIVKHYCTKHARMLYPAVKLAHPALIGAYHD